MLIFEFKIPQCSKYQWTGSPIACYPLFLMRGNRILRLRFAKDVNQRKADRLPHEAGLRLLSVPRAPKELPVTAHLRNAHGVAEWKLFRNE
jgi:hypothetical protein